MAPYTPLIEHHMCVGWVGGWFIGGGGGGGCARRVAVAFTFFGGGLPAPTALAGVDGRSPRW
jgi:hypothetical protein